MFTLETVNDVKVKPLKTITKIPPEKIKGYELFPEIYSNIYLCAKKASGKTSLINTIIKKCSDKYSKFYIFCSTVSMDPAWIQMVQDLKDRGNDVECYTSISEGKVNILDDILKELKQAARERQIAEEEEKKKKQDPVIARLSEREKLFKKIFGEDEEEVKERKPKKIAPEIFFILDDLGQELRDKAVAQLLKTNRHFLSKCILSGQYMNDLSVQGRKNLNYVILFGGHSLDKLETIYKDINLSVGEETFLDLYKDATSERFNFLYIDILNQTFRKNLNKKYILED